MNKTFEDYLHGVFMNDAPEDVGDKDSFEDNFNKWLEYQGADMLIQHAEKWGEKVGAETAKEVTELICKNFKISGLVD